MPNSFSIQSLASPLTGYRPSCVRQGSRVQEVGVTRTSSVCPLPLSNLRCGREITDPLEGVSVVPAVPLGAAAGDVLDDLVQRGLRVPPA